VDSGYVAVLVRAARSVRIYRDGAAVLDVPLDSALAAARTAAGRRGSQLPAAMLRAEAANERLRAAVYLRSLDGRTDANGPQVNGATGVVLLKPR
jgi:hypothetical protein